MDSLRTQPLASRPSSVPTSSPSPPLALTNDDIEAVIQMATSARPSPDGRTGPLRDTRTQLFVGNLPYRVRWQDLKDLFRKAGTVLRADVSLGPDNRSRGYGTVLLATAEDAGRAVDMFNGYSWQTRTLEVRPDRLPPDFDSPLGNATAPSGTTFPASVSGSLASPFSAPQASSSSISIASASEDIDYSSFFGHEMTSRSGDGCRNLFVGNLPFHCQWQDLKDLFRQAGTILRADVALGQDGRSRGFGTVVFATELDAERAVKMFNGYEYNGRALKVHHDKFSQTSQPTTTPASPSLHASFQSAPSSGNANNIPSFTSSMSSRPTHISLPMGYPYDFRPASPTSPFDIYHSQLQMSMQQQQRQQQQTQPASRQFYSQSSLGIDDLTAALASTSISQSTSSSSSSSKPSRSTATSSSSSATSLTTNTSATSASSHHPHSHTQTQSHSQPNLSHHSHHSHPHHPGPISLPPPPQVTFPSHTLSPHGMMTASPHHHPINMSPLHHPSQQHPHMVPLTPHGLPPITPSMPPFTFLPPQLSPLHHPSHSNGMSHSHLSESQNYPYSPNGLFTPRHHPLSSPSMSPSHPSSPIFPNHSYQHVLNTFSPGVAMSPGAIWGRPGGSNPFINPAVGAPVHVHSPGHGGLYYQMSPNHPGHVHGGGGMGAEPGEYFDPGYFPPMAPLGASGLANEIMKDSKGGGELKWEQQKDIEGVEERREERNENNGNEAGQSTESGPDSETKLGTPTGKTLWNTTSEGDLRKWEGREELVESGAVGENLGLEIGVGDLNNYSTPSAMQRPVEATLIHRPDSDPAPTNIPRPGGGGTAGPSTIGVVRRSLSSRAASPWQKPL